MARKITQSQQTQDNESLVRVFFRGFFWPLRMIGAGLAWLSHKPPLRQIGHGLRWFLQLKPVRLVGRILGLGYIRSSWGELRQVTWPTFRESRRLTLAVIIFSVIFGALIALSDFGLDRLFKKLILE